MTEITISVYRLSSAFLRWVAGAWQRNGTGIASAGGNWPEGQERTAVLKKGKNAPGFVEVGIAIECLRALVSESPR
jgi:hypothetical protein